ncbi:MAG: hypothetical protein MK368_01830 [SAR324 cluster bacterium]|uniref:Co-chaperone DjlA N-terminal domain-containing protein n=1 Tax=marine metagenome TaxID=408172 RepID=A0A382ARJ1_9ZZZZ|nr:hypothetical protein [SAR324 cluster bacterium]|tara:strand:- start:215 stop:700 length:486 start_codon:yes stop_codon:yes gene_type:complete
MYKLHLDRELAKDVFINSSKETLDWVVNAIANIVVADGIIEKHEFVALQEAIGLLQDKEEIHALMDRVKKKEIIEIKSIRINDELAIKVFFYLAAIAVIDGELKKSEAEMLKKCGLCMGLDDDLIKAVIQWTLKQMEINRKLKEDLNKSNNFRSRIIESIL